MENIKNRPWSVLERNRSLIDRELLEVLKGAQSALRKALPYCPADKEAIYCGEWLDTINEAIAKAEGGIK